MSKDLQYERIDGEDDSYSDDDLFNISSWGADLSVREIVTMYEENELIKPELQRKYVWSQLEASRFIDSVLLGLPIPSIFLAKEGSKRLIIDGYQRIMTLCDFINGLFSESNRIFKLTNSEMINQRWRNKAFKELTSDEQTRIKIFTIHAIVFEQKHPDNNTAMYQIFERINTGGRTLKAQEIRNCIYQGAFNTLLFKLNKNTDWRYLLNIDEEDSRMADLEYILRFFAILYLNGRKEAAVKQLVLKKYLNIFMGENKKIDSSKEDLFSNLFNQTMHIIKQKLGQYAFHNINDNGEFTKFNPAIFDAISVATAHAITKGLDAKLNENNGHVVLLRNAKFQEAISFRTTNIENIFARINLASQYLYGTPYESKP